MLVFKGGRNMKLNLKWLKINPRESESFFIQEDLDAATRENLGFKFLEPVELEALVENTGDEFELRGRVKTSVELMCGRCLREFACHVDTPILFTMVEGLHAEGDALSFEGDWADISPRIAEAIYMAVPMVPLCSENCRGLCPVCGTDLNLHTCTCNPVDLDPRWEKLKNLL